MSDFSSSVFKDNLQTKMESSFLPQLPTSKKCIQHNCLVQFPHNTKLLYMFFLPTVLSSSFSYVGLSNFQYLFFVLLLSNNL